MVIQQQMPVKIWGWAEAGEKVTVTLADQSSSTTADESGTWRVELPALMASSDSIRFSVEGKNTVELKNVLVGEVWLCSGQSNMEWSVARSANATNEIAAAKFPLIRHIKIPRTPSTMPLDDAASDWQECSPETVSSFTACGYFMARKLHQELDVPIGLVNSSWGGTKVEPWTPPVGFGSVPALSSIYDSVLGKTPGSKSYNNALSEHISETEKWIVDAKQKLESAEAVESPPKYPASLTPYSSHQDPTMLYNGMIHPLVGFPIRGAIWYQGESNHTDGMLYLEKKTALIQGWRELWEQGNFPFYFVQIAPFQYGQESPSILPEFWEAQSAVLKLPNTGMVVINDIATLNDIHPPNKQDVGLRLANLALKNDYGKTSLVVNGPTFEDIETNGGTLTVKFKNTGGGLKTRDGATPTDFEMIGPDSGGFQIATAEIDGDSVRLSSDQVKTPTAFRFAWNKLAEPNLIGGTGLPAGAVRGGKVPSFTETLPIKTEYQLVYQIDLSKVGPKIKYDVDNRVDVGEFDRIAYLVELESKQFGDQKVFVSMNAFTDDVNKIGIPTASSKADFQKTVSGVEVFSNVDSVKQGSIDEGNIEFWPNNYSPANAAQIPNATNKYDWGDTKGLPKNGYGSMQVHNFKAKQTIFSINNWKNGKNADFGIGNRANSNSDWTFSANGSSYQTKSLKVFVRERR